MPGKVLGPLSWAGSRDNEGHRQYDIEWLVEVDDPWNEGPEVVSRAPELPTIGTLWVVGFETDPYAFCRPESTISPVITGEPNNLFTVSQVFSTKPLKESEKQGNDTSNPANNPLVKPPQISGSFVKYTKEATTDRSGNPILSSSHERFKGPVVERDFNRHNIKITMPVATLPLGTYTEMIDTVNVNPLWGLDPRTIKLSNVSWTKQYYGSSWTSYFYEITYDFDIDFLTFDRLILNEGSLEYKGVGNRNDPANWKKYTKEGQPAIALYDKNGDLITDRSGTPSVIELDGTEITAGDAGAACNIQVEFYNESDFLGLGVPSTL